MNFIILIILLRVIVLDCKNLLLLIGNTRGMLMQCPSINVIQMVSHIILFSIPSSVKMDRIPHHLS